MVQQIARQDLATLNDAKELKTEIEMRVEELDKQKDQEKVQVDYLQAKQTQIQSELLKEKALLATVENQVVTLEEEEKKEQERRLAQQAKLKKQTKNSSNGFSSSIKLSAFPVAGPHAYSDTFGDYRSGGRTHKGTDIYALKNTPLVAVVNGVIHSKVTQKLGGIVIRVSGDDGHLYCYAHLDGYADGILVGSRVKAGQTIAYVGNTGNASGGPDHLHFEVHPNGGAAVDPYPILRSTE
jgi:murein DD-endopeptidase MepM/ murein hydrolase activator NlpD